MGCSQTTRYEHLPWMRQRYAHNWYAGEGISGKVCASQRLQFAKLLEHIRDGGTSVVAKLDRLGRDALDVGSTIKALCTRKIQVIVLELGKLDITSPAGKRMLTMLAVVGEMERDLLVERTQARLARAKQEGKTPGYPTKTNETRRIEIMAKHRAGISISELARQYGVSRLSIARIAKRAGLGK